MEIVFRNPSDLSVHPSLKGQPSLSAEHPSFKAMLTSVNEDGIIQPLLIDDADQVLDGRHRLRSARLNHLKQVPCVIMPGDHVVTLVLETLLARRHYTKGALAYLALPLLDQAIAEGTTRRMGKLKKGKSSVESLSDSTGKSGRAREVVAGQFGVSNGLLAQAQSVSKLFTERDAVILQWLEISPEATEEWNMFDQEMAGAWNAFREQWCKRAGVDLDDPKDALLVPPESFRERWEPDLFEGEIGLGGIIQAASGLLSTKGKTRGDLADGEIAAYAATLRRVNSFNADAFKRWSELPPERRVPVLKALTEAVPQWPDDARRALYASLKAVYGA